VRLALGARLAAVGLACGLVFAAVAARFLEAQLFAVSPRDAVSYASAIRPLDAIRAE
jgi:hypothetical protein